MCVYMCVSVCTCACVSVCVWGVGVGGVTGVSE